MKIIFSDNSTSQEQTDGFEIFTFSYFLPSHISIVICLSSSNVPFVELLCSMFLMSSALVCIIHIWNAAEVFREQENYVNPSLNSSVYNK